MTQAGLTFLPLTKVDNEDQDQTAQNLHSDLGSTLSDTELFLSPKSALFGRFLRSI